MMLQALARPSETQRDPQKDAEIETPSEELDLFEAVLMLLSDEETTGVC